MGAPLGDPDGRSDIPEPDARVTHDAQEQVSVVGEESQGTGHFVGAKLLELSFMNIEYSVAIHPMRGVLMPDEKGNTTADAVQDTPLHAYKQGREEDVNGTMARGEQDAGALTKTGGATSGGPPARGSESTGTDYSKVKKSAGEDQKEDGNRHRTVGDTPASKEGSGEMGLGSESGALGGGESPPNNPDPSTKGATKGTEGAL